MKDNDVVAKVRELKELKAFADELAAEISFIEDELKSEMAARGVDELVADVFKLRYKDVVSTRFDKKTMIAMTSQELYDSCCREVVTKRFSVA